MEGVSVGWLDDVELRERLPVPLITTVDHNNGLAVDPAKDELRVKLLLSQIKIVSLVISEPWLSRI